MTEHKTVAVVEAPEREIEKGSVEHLVLTIEHPSDGDPFSKDISDIRKMSGTNQTFKRRLSTEINKVRRGLDGAASTQYEPEADGVTSGYNILDVVEPPYNLDYLAKLYELSSPHYAAVNAKVANIVGLGYNLVENAKTKRSFESIADNEAKVKRVRNNIELMRDELLQMLDNFNEEDTFTETLVKFWRDYEVTGNGYIEIGRKKDGSIGYVGHIPSQTIRVRKKRDGFIQMASNKIIFFGNFGDGGKDDSGRPKRITNPVSNDTPNEIIHMKRYSPTSTFYGVPDIVAAKQAIAGNEFAARFNLDYFENKAVPRHLIILKGASLGRAHQDKLLKFFETGLKGQNHRSLFIPLPAGDKENPVDFEIKPIETGIQDASFNNYRKANLSDILMAHRVPITKISVSENVALALANDADKTFKEQVCAPEQRILEKKLNRIVRELTDVLELKLNEMTLTDAKTQSDIDTAMVKSGIWLPNEVRTRDGKPAIEGGNERVNPNTKSNSAAQQVTNANSNRERDATRAANATDSNGASRNPKGQGRTTP